MSARDPLELLREAWATLPVPEPTRELPAEDAATRAAVAWAARAWQALPVPPRRSAPRRVTRRVAHRVTWLARGPGRGLAAAALLLGLLSLPLLLDGLRPTIRRTPAPSDAGPLAGGPQLDAPAIDMRATATGIELRSGPVRLLLSTRSLSSPVSEVP